MRARVTASLTGRIVCSVLSRSAAEDAGDNVGERLRGALRGALRERDAVATAAFRSALAAIASAEAVPVCDVPVAPASSPHFVGARAGPGEGAEQAGRLRSEASALAQVVGPV